MARILLAEDEAALARGLARYLEGEGHTVRTAKTGKEAIRMLAGDVDLVITDINMPDMDGVELIVQVTREHPALPVIAMSGGGMFAKEMLLDTAGKLGAVVTLEKPFDLDALGKAVVGALDDPTQPSQ